MTATGLRARLEEHPRPVLLDFWAPWCGPCRAMAPLLEDVEREFEGRVDVWRVNVDGETQAAAEFRVRVIPTLVGVHGGREVTRAVGAPSRAHLRSLFEQAETGVRVAATVALRDRIIRLAAAAGLALVGWRADATVLYVAAALALAAAFHDLLVAPFRRQR